jgi:type IV pilus assembly protein PilX
MNNSYAITTRTARGFVLIASLLLLIVMTLLALAMFRSFGIQELVAGNVREKQRALQSAIAAEQYAELWLTAPGNAVSDSVDCQNPLVTLQSYSGTANPYICLLPVGSLVTTVTSVPWKVGTSEIGWTFFPGGKTGTGDMNVSPTGGQNTYYQVPRLYIGILSSTTTQTLYRIDAWNWGGTTNTAAVVEATYAVTSQAQSASGP